MARDEASAAASAAPGWYRSRAAWVALAALAAYALAVIVYALDHWDGIYDDAFIYLRYARNIGEGCALRFNCDGPRVEGFTSPLHLLLLWIGSWLTDQLIWLCQVLGTAAVVATGALAAAAAAAWHRRAAAPWAPAVLAIAAVIALGLDPFFKLNANTGMETALGAATVTLVFLAVLRERPWLLVGAVVASTLVRPEAMLFVIALPLLPWMRRPRYLGAALGLLLAITAARYALFGELVPNTYLAKSGGTLRHAAIGLDYIADALADFPLAFLAPLALLGPRRREVGYLLAVAAAWLAFFLRSGGDLFEYSRLWLPLVPGLTVLALAGVRELALRARAPALQRASLAAPLVFALVLGGRAALAHHIPPQGVSDRVVLWAATGTYLRKHFKGATVATVPIGAIGYYSRLPIIDLVGLTEPEIARAGRSVPEELLTKRWIGHERNHTEYVLARAPKVIATTSLRDHPWRTLAEARAGFWSDWLLLQEIKAGRARYRVHDAEVLPGRHVLMLVSAE